MVVRPGPDIQIAAQRDHVHRQGHLLGDRQGEDATAAVADQQHGARLPARDELPQRIAHGVDDRLRVALHGPQQGPAISLSGQAVVAGAPQVDGRPRVQTHQVEHQRVANAGVPGRIAPLEPGPTVAAEIDVQQLTAGRSGELRIAAQAHSPGLQGAHCPGGVTGDRRRSRQRRAGRCRARADQAQAEQGEAKR